MLTRSSTLIKKKFFSLTPNESRSSSPTEFPTTSSSSSSSSESEFEFERESSRPASINNVPFSSTSTSTISPSTPLSISSPLNLKLFPICGGCGHSLIDAMEGVSRRHIMKWIKQLGWNQFDVTDPSLSPEVNLNFFDGFLVKKSVGVLGQRKLQYIVNKAHTLICISPVSKILNPLF